MFNLNLGFSRSQTDQITEFQSQYIGNWVWRAVAALIDDNKTQSPKELSEKLNASPNEVLHALKGLVKLGIIRRTANGYKKILKYTFFSDKNLDPNLLFSDHILISHHILQKLKTNEIHKSFYRTSFVGTTEKKFKEFTEKVEKAFKAFLIESDNAPVEQVYAITLSCANLTENSSPLAAGPHIEATSEEKSCSSE